MFFPGGEPTGGAGADGLTHEDDFFGRTFQRADEMLVGGFDGALAFRFTGRAGAFSVAGVVVGEDAEAELLEALDGVGERTEVFGIAVRPQEGGHSFVGWKISCRDMRGIWRGDFDEVTSLVGIGCIRWPEDELVGEEESDDEKNEIN